jgi:hypothetical protein
MGEQVGMQTAAQAVPHHGTPAHLAAHNDTAAPRRRGRGAVGRGEQRNGCRKHPKHKMGAVQTATPAVQSLEHPHPPQPMALGQGHTAVDQTASRARPRRRRARTTRRPVWVRMRTRNPDTRLGLRLVPSNVRLVMTAFPFLRF